MSLNSTVIQAFGKGTSGQVLFESFESPSWQTDESWTIIQGTPAPVQTFAQDGQWSLPIDSSYPIIQNSPAETFTHAVVYFYDDATQTASTLLPFALVSDSAGNQVGIGVDCSVNTGTYTGIGKPFDGNSHFDTGVPRTTGWHRFQFEFSPGHPFKIYGYIDGVKVLEFISFFVSSLTQINLGPLPGNFGLPLFGYFDNVQLSTGTNLVFGGLLPNGGQAVLFDQDWNQVGTTGGSNNISLGLTPNFPYTGYIMYTQNDGVTPAFYSPLTQFWGGDTWTMAAYDFGRAPSSFDSAPMVERKDMYSGSGLRQSLFFYSMDKIKIGFQGMTEDQKNKWMGFFSFIQNGQQFSVAIFKFNVFLSFLANGVNVPATFGGTQIQMLSTAGLAVGARLVLRSADGLGREIHKIAAINASTGVVTFDGPLLYNFNDGDMVRSLYYWPQAITNDKKADVKTSQMRAPLRFEIGMTFEEALTAAGN